MVGEAEADNMLSLCKSDRKAKIREIKRSAEEEGETCGEKTMQCELMKMWCQGIKSKSSSRTREQHTGREVILCSRCIMHGHQLNKEEMEREYNVLQEFKVEVSKYTQERREICMVLM